MTNFTGFMNDVNRYTLNLASMAWVLYSPIGDLVSSGGVCLGPSTNNIIEYHTVIGLLMGALANDVRDIRVYLDSKLVVQQLNRVYTIRNPLLLRTFQRVRILESSFEQVLYQHIPRHLNAMVDSPTNFFLVWYIAHS